MSKFIMAIGLPACGKSSISKKMAQYNNNLIVHSSDELRLELFGSYDIQDKNTELFKELEVRVVRDLKNSKDVFLDATNLSMRKRKHFLSLLPKDTIKEALVVATTVNTCLLRDSYREKEVGESVIIRMWKSFNFPVLGEGFNKISIVYNEEVDKFRRYDNYFACASVFKQDTPYHTLTVGEHQSKAFYSYYQEANHLKISYNVNIAFALMIHDIGKLFTKTFKNSKGIITDQAHFYGHENVSSYEAMFLVQFTYIKNTIEICQLVQYHMRPYMAITEKSKKKLIDLLGKKMYENILIMNKHDRLAH